MSKTKVKVNWDLHELVYMRKNFAKMTWNQLLDGINEMRDDDDQVELGALRHQCHRLGLKKCIQIRWSQADINFLRKNYRTMGNVEMARILTEKKRSSRVIDGKKTARVFTSKNVEKKIKLLNLHRSPEDLRNIRSHNKSIGMGFCFTSEKNAWSLGLRTVASNEEVRIWTDTTGHKRRFVKVDGRFIPYTPWFYRNFIGPVPEGHIVYHRDSDTLNDDPDNLALVTRRGFHSTEHLQSALSLLEKREQTILDALPRMDYDKDRDTIKRTHSDLNRIRKIQASIKAKLSKRFSSQQQPDVPRPGFQSFSMTFNR